MVSQLITALTTLVSLGFISGNSITSSGSNINISNGLYVAGILTVNSSALIQGLFIGTGPYTDVGTFEAGQNVGIGNNTLSVNTTGKKNVFIGTLAGSSNTTGLQNVGIGWNSLLNNSTGNNNTGVGVAALLSTTTGPDNTAVGKSSLHNNLTGFSNTAIGTDSQTLGTTGTYNTSVGAASMSIGVITGTSNCALGYGAVNSLTSGARNIGIGFGALASVTTANFNVAIGYNALTANTASSNIAMGHGAASSNTSGTTNTAIGQTSLATNTSGSGNVVLGYYAGAYETGSNAFYVNNQDRTNTAGDKASSLLYGVFAASATNQTLAINAALTVTGTIGVGKASTAATVDVNGDISSGGPTTTGAYRLMDTSNAVRWSMYLTSNDLRFYDHYGVGNLITFQNGGKVGIGTTSPGSLLDVQGGNINTSGSITSTKAGTNLVGGIILNSSQPKWLFINSGATATNKVWTNAVSGNSMSFSIVDDNDTSATTWLNATRNGASITNVTFPNGNVGIGATPGEKLEVNGNAIITGVVKIKNYTVATLPSASTYSYSIAFVTDATTTAITGLGTTVSGGGSNKVPVYSDGTNWIII